MLNTNVVSEWTKPRPSGGVITWPDEADEDRVFLSVAALAELRQGVERLVPGACRKKSDSLLREELSQRRTVNLPTDETKCDFPRLLRIVPGDTLMRLWRNGVT